MLFVSWLFVGAALGQSEEALKANVIAAKYPPLAEMARIQGNVLIEANLGTVRLLAGHPLLAGVAMENAKKLGALHNQARVDMIYHFIIVDTAHSVSISTTVKKGNSVERVFLRALRLKTEKAVTVSQCEDGVAPANIVKSDGAAIEVWVFGRTRCIQTQYSSSVAASREI